MVAPVFNVSPGKCSMCSGEGPLFLFDWIAGKPVVIQVRAATDTHIGACRACIEQLGMYLFSWAQSQGYSPDHSGAKLRGPR